MTQPKPPLPVPERKRRAPAPARAGQRAPDRGVSLIEALIAFLVVSAGMLGLMRSQDGLRLNSEASRHRSEALRLAQQTLEDQRAFATLQPQAGLHDYTAIQSGSHSAHSGTGFQTNTAYQVQRHVAANPDLALKSSHVEVAWTDRQGQPQSLSLHALVAGQDPALAVSLSQPPRAHPAWGPQGRSPFIPQRAKDLGNGHSAFKPLGQGSVAWVFDNISGRVTAACTGLPANVWHGNLTPNHLSQCSATDNLLLSGVVRFSLTNPPTPAAANDPPLPLSVALQLNSTSTPSTTATPPLCVSEPVEEVQVATPGGPATEWVPLGASPGSLGLNPWTATGERFVSYHCLVDMAGGSVAWSGRSDVQPAGWAIGLNPGQYRVCRYSSDTDDSGAVDRNEEHPATYTQVRTPLTQQHFLVVRGELACPVSPPVKVDGVGLQVYADWSTAQHQP